MPTPIRMLAYLSRVSLWLAALAAASSLFAPADPGALLASVAIVALVVALVLRRFELKARRAAALAEADDGPPTLLDESGVLDVAAALARAVAGAATLVDALQALRLALIHELGAREVTVLEAPPGVPLVVPQRYPLGEAFASGRVTGSAAAGFALPVLREADVVAMVCLRGTALAVDDAALAGLLTVAKAPLDALAAREAPPVPAAVDADAGAGTGGDAPAAAGHRGGAGAGGAA